jgi:hypothetical protein
MTTITAKKIFPVRVRRSTLLYRQNWGRTEWKNCGFAASGFNGINVLDTGHELSLRQGEQQNDH